MNTRDAILDALTEVDLVVDMSAEDSLNNLKGTLDSMDEEMLTQVLMSLATPPDMLKGLQGITGTVFMLLGQQVQLLKRLERANEELITLKAEAGQVTWAPVGEA